MRNVDDLDAKQPSTERDAIPPTFERLRVPGNTSSGPTELETGALPFHICGHGRLLRLFLSLLNALCLYCLQFLLPDDV